MREIINKSDPVAIPLMCGHPHRAMDITVDKLEVSGSSRSGGRERVSMHLASFAGFIYCIRVCLRIKLDSCDQVRKVWIVPCPCDSRLGVLKLDEI